MQGSLCLKMPIIQVINRPVLNTPMKDRSQHAGRRHLLQEELRRHTLELLDRRWHQLWGSFGISMILLGFGSKLLWSRPETHAPLALLLIAGGLLVWWLHRHILVLWVPMVGHRQDWLTRRDQACVAVSMWISVMAPAQAQWWPVPVLVGSGYGMWQLLGNARQHWHAWFFAQARQTLRQGQKR